MDERPTAERRRRGASLLADAPTASAPPAARPRLRRTGRPQRLAFAEAVEVLETVDVDSDAGRGAALRAADALLALAEQGASADLAAILTPAPDAPSVVWTVACYQIGDLTPSALQDFSEPVTAVTTLCGCPDPSHVAAELLASTEAGLRWAALVRTGERIEFQRPPLGMTGTDTPPADAAARWRAHLDTWADGGDDTPGVTPGGVDRRAAASVVTAPPPPPAERADDFDLGYVLGQLVAGLRNVETTLARVDQDRARTEQRLAAVEAVAVRSDEMDAAVERRLAAIEARVERVMGPRRPDPVAVERPAPPGPRPAPVPLPDEGPAAVVPAARLSQAVRELWGALLAEGETAARALTRRLVDRRAR